LGTALKRHQLGFKKKLEDIRGDSPSEQISDPLKKCAEPWFFWDALL
jgi:hypothetical protein